MIADISKDLLFKWWSSLKILKFADFKIQFAFDHLKRVVNAYYGLQAREALKEGLVEVDGDIIKVS